MEDLSTPETRPNALVSQFPGAHESIASNLDRFGSDFSAYASSTIRRMKIKDLWLHGGESKNGHLILRRTILRRGMNIGTRV